MRFEVPQFIEIEDKIFGPLSWRQFLYIGGGLGMAAVIFITLGVLWFVFIGLPIAGLSAALAFYPVNSRPFSYFLEAMFNYTTKQRLYLWRQENPAVHKGSETLSTQPNSPTSAYHPTIAKPPTPKPNKDIASMARRLELQAMQKPHPERQ